MIKDILRKVDTGEKSKKSKLYKKWRKHYTESWIIEKEKCIIKESRAVRIIQNSRYKREI